GGVERHRSLSSRRPPHWCAGAVLSGLLQACGDVSCGRAVEERLCVARGLACPVEEHLPGQPTLERRHDSPALSSATRASICARRSGPDTRHISLSASVSVHSATVSAGGSGAGLEGAASGSGSTVCGARLPRVTVSAIVSGLSMC